jgi:signal transduction histidine kinase/CheY-like chemotaxis protein
MFKKVIVLACLFVLGFFYPKQISAQSESEKDSLESILPFANDVQRADILIGLANCIKSLDSAKAGNYARQAQIISQKLNYCKGMANSFLILGILEKGRGDLAKAKLLYLQGLSLAIKCKEPYAVSLAYHSLGNLANIKDDIAVAMRYYIGSVKISEQLLDYPRMARTYNNIGTLYMELKNFEKAEEYYIKAYDLFKNSENDLIQAEIANNLATIYHLKGFHLKALYYYSNALEVFRRKSSAHDISSALNNIGLVYIIKKQPRKGIPFLAESYLIDRTINNIKGSIMVLSNLCEAYTILNMPDSAFYYLNKGFSLIPSYPSSEEAENLYQAAASIYAKQGDNAKRDYYRSLAQKIGDNNKVNPSKNEAKYIAIEYENELKRNQLAILQKENEIKDLKLREQELSIQQQNIFLIVTGIAIFFLLLISGLLFLAVSLNKKNKLFEMSNKAKTAMLQQINHEIRTPLNGIVGMSQMAMESKTFSELKEYLTHIKLSSDELMFVLNNLITYLQLDRKEAAPANAPFNLLESLEDLFKSTNSVCKQKGLLFHQMVYPGVPARINTDKQKLLTILHNLINNAIKHSLKGVVKIEIKQSAKRVKDGIALSTLQFCVIDEGEGLSEKEIKQLFKYTPNNSTNSNGFGIGLTNVKQLCDLMKGHIEVISEKGAGSSFIVEIEVEVVEDDLRLKEEQSAKINYYQPSNYKVLIVEDNQLNQRLFIKILEKEGYQHTVADNGLKALQILQEKAYDLILMDIRMPEMDGIEAAHHIRNREEFSIDKNVPIIVVTAHDDADERKKCYELGINEYLTKPIDKDLLLQKIKEQILARSPLK